MILPLQILQVLTQEYGKREIYRESGSLGDQLLIPKSVASSLPKSSVVCTNTSHLYSQQVQFRAVTCKGCMFLIQRAGIVDK